MTRGQKSNQHTNKRAKNNRTNMVSPEISSASSYLKLAGGAERRWNCETQRKNATDFAVVAVYHSRISQFSKKSELAT